MAIGTRACETCTYFDETRSECHRFPIQTVNFDDDVPDFPGKPPSLIKLQSYKFLWPPITDPVTFWCGEWTLHVSGIEGMERQDKVV